MNTKAKKLVSATVPLSCVLSVGAPAGTNYDESKVGDYVLPDPLTCEDGAKVADAETWRTKRRSEVLELFRANMHGRSPERPETMAFRVTSVDAGALDGLATRKEVTVLLGGDQDGPKIHLLVYLPNKAEAPAPAFVGVNFNGNHTVCDDPGITIAPQWVWDGKAKREELDTPGEDTRGSSAGRWQVAKLMARGYALATVSRADVEPDYPTGWKHGIRGALLKQSGQTEFAPDAWGAIGAWAWSLSRALDYLETEPRVDARRAAVIGHSRMGKTALWAGAQDERFAIVISNNSGEGGAALARRWYGETTAVMNRNFPHWFCRNFKQFSGREDTMPTDQHEMLSLVAPRPVYIASATEDRWADPRGEFLSAKHAEPVYRLFGKAGLGVDDMPPNGTSVGDTIGYHIRAGKHNITEFDWEQYLDFADRHF